MMVGSTLSRLADDAYFAQVTEVEGGLWSLSQPVEEDYPARPRPVGWTSSMRSAAFLAGILAAMFATVHQPL